MREIKFEVAFKKKNSSESWKEVLTLDDLLNRNGCLYNPAVVKIIYKRQFTGMIDTDGREIYEGDIVNCWNWGQEKRLLSVSIVEWSNDDKGWWLNPDPTDGDRYDLFREVEVIGNIYENPELLK